MLNTSDSTGDLNQELFEAQQLQGIKDWVSANLNGEVIEMTRLERWRPQWKVSYRVDDQVKAVLVRGNRPIADEASLRFEMDVMLVLQENGIKVPHIHGWMDSPTAFVMDWIDTDDRAPGMLHTAMENPTSMDDERWQALLNYMTDLDAIHRVPVSKFSHIERLNPPPSTPKEIALHATEGMYNAGASMGNIDTALEFLQHWLRRNVPEHREVASFVAGDAGQFMSAGTGVLAVMDFEIANIGDTHWDLACFRGRHPYENMGDIPALYREYERVSGKEVDLPVVAYYTVAFLQLAAIGATFFTLPMARGGNWIEGILEYASITRRAYEAIAELKGYELSYDFHLPEPTSHRMEESGLNKLMADIKRLPTSSAFEPWERELMHAIPEFLLNYTRYRDWFDQQTVNDINSVTGQEFNNLSEADKAILELIVQNDSKLDEQMVQVMHRRTLRLSMIIAGTDPDSSNPLFHILDPIL